MWYIIIINQHYPNFEHVLVQILALVIVLIFQLKLVIVALVGIPMYYYILL